MKKLTYLFAAGVLLAGTACSGSETGTMSSPDDTMGSTTGSTTGGTTGSTTGSTTGTTTRGTTTGTSTTTGTTTAGGTTTGTTTGGGSTSGTTTGTTAGTTGGTTTTSTTGTTTGGTTTGGMNTSGGGNITSMTNMDDATFMMTAASSNLLEIQTGKMAEERATSPKVKQFGKMMVDHHTKATQEMKTLASEMGVTLPTTLMPMHKTMLDKLSGQTDAEFDEAYMDLMETAHKMDIAMFEAKSKNATSPSVKAFATKTLPMLRSHHKEASETESTVD